jgi:hypothetical protein
MSMQSGETTLSTPSGLGGQTVDLAQLENAQIETTGQASCLLSPVAGHRHETGGYKFELSGEGTVAFFLPTPVDVATSFGIWLWAHAEADAAASEIHLLFDHDREIHLGSVDKAAWQAYYQPLKLAAPAKLLGIEFRGTFSGFVELSELCLGQPDQSASLGQPLEEQDLLPTDHALMPAVGEEVSIDIRKEDISFVLESRSVSSVVRFVYTPIEGNLSDIELEINNGDAINPLEEGGITIEMGGREWSATDEDIERHFVSCEIVGDSVEARWQWKCGDELADFLYRLRMQGKSLHLEFEGGTGKATGVTLGHVSGAPHPRQIQVPYLTLGDGHPQILCLSGVFMSAYMDMSRSNASTLSPPDPTAENGQLQLNGGCHYLPTVDGRRSLLHERLVLTVSRQFSEVLPQILPAAQTLDTAALRNKAWYTIDSLEASEEAYIDAYEHLRNLYQWGLESVIVNHSADTWSDDGSIAGMTAEGAAAKGGPDALEEYLDAVQDMGYTRSLYQDFSNITPMAETWSPDVLTHSPDGSLAQTPAQAYQLKNRQALTQGPDHAASLRKRYGVEGLFLGVHASTPAWNRLDSDSRLEQPDGLRQGLATERALLQQLSQAGLIFAEGGSHWLMAGLAHGFLANQPAGAHQMPFIPDFALGQLHTPHINAGLGTIEQFYGDSVDAETLHGSSEYLDRYIALTAAFGHAACLPSAQRWGIASTAKVYCMLRPLQELYLGATATQILYHHDGNLLEATEAIIAGAHEQSQVQITYDNGLQIHINAGTDSSWSVEYDEVQYTLEPNSFLATAPDGLLVFSADRGEGRIDYAQTPTSLYFDTRGQEMDMGPVKMTGSALVSNENWKLDIRPFHCSSSMDIFPGFYWEERKRLPKLRVLAYLPDDESRMLKPVMAEKRLTISPVEHALKYRITLPEWMVEPGK